MPMSSLPTLQYDLPEGLESQLTLVDASVNDAPTPHVVLSLSRNDMKNTRFLSATGETLYSVTTDSLTNAYTIVLRGDNHKVAEIKRKDLREDRIKFGGSPSSIKLSQWLHGANGKWSDFPVSFNWQNKTYNWKSNSTRQLALYDSVDGESQIAWFQTSRRGVVDGEPAIFSAQLALQKEALEILDAVIVSLLIVEQQLRMKEMKYRNAIGYNTFHH